MPTIKINKPSQKQTTKQVVKQSVKVIVEAPKKKIRRKRKATVSKSSKEAKIIEQLPIYTPFYIAQPSTSQPSNVQTSAQSLTTTAFNPALDKVNNMRVEEGKKRGGLSTTTISLNEILPSAPEEIKELEPSKPEKPQITIPKGGAPEKHESGLNKKQMISRINDYNTKNKINDPAYSTKFLEVKPDGKRVMKEKQVDDIRIIFNEYEQKGFL
jgi:hypothetical protein